MTTLDRLAALIYAADTDALLKWAHDHQTAHARKRAKKAPRRAQERATKATRSESWRQTREAVLRRAGGRCELCGCHGFALDCHHLASGPLRRKYEAPNSVIACCRVCHNAWHKGTWIDLQASIEAAQRIAAPDIVMANLNRRLQKATGVP